MQLQQQNQLNQLVNTDLYLNGQTFFENDRIGTRSHLRSHSICVTFDDDIGHIGDAHWAERKRP